MRISPLAILANEKLTKRCRVCEREFTTVVTVRTVCDDCVEQSRLLDAERLRHARLLEAEATIRASGLTGELVDMTLANFDAKLEPTAWQAVKTFVTEWPRQYRNLALLGGPGCGKTHLAVGLHRYALTKGRRPYYANWPEIWRLIDKSSDRQAAESKYLDPCFTCDLLVIDDAGRESGTSYKDNWLDVLINNRHREQRATVITANMTEARLDEWLGAASSSRFGAYCDVVTLSGEDRRGKVRRVARLNDLGGDPTVVCATCKGARFVYDERRPVGSKDRTIVCPSCGGKGY